ncbi:hypothetical protein [Flavobacterium sp.]|uniref:hypothetical protein n=1 Tax=Flavobacterium sp. TaxID=239 RepID=UPI00248879D2|nr:hypothetical protein [Flavobacterium sp.]MDI1317153.1 hypothetical protein [Flavobacterium sp.]
MIKRTLTIFLALLSLTAFSQPNSSSTEKAVADKQNGAITLQKLVDKIKLENESLRNAKAINVMVNDLMIDDLDTFMIEPKNILRTQVLILDQNGANRDGMKPSIIINTRKK